MAQCGFQLARLQMLADESQARRAFLEPYGIDDPDFNGDGLEQQDRFIRACIAKAHR
jgi:hypothetical protein